MKNISAIFRVRLQSNLKRWAAKFLQKLTALQSVTAALSACGLSDFTRAETRITAKLANPLLALHLRLAEGAALLRSVAVNIDAAGQPVEFGQTWFAGDRVSLTVAPD